MVERIFITNNDIKLEAELFQSKLGTENVLILICHPHPQYGGNMFNNVVSGVFNKLVRNNISCLRFNFRGVGRSTGTYSDGTGELSDVHTCIDFLINERKCEKIFLCGYSYGAAIGCSAVGYSDKIVGYISISFPWSFMGSKYKEFSQSSKPKLFIQGDKDTVAHYGNFQENFDYYLDPKKKKIIEGADHFYGNYEEQVANVVLEFLRNL
ncbi:MAG: alpha/beta hydrolase [Candidatus Lokiarchaeota archaeon]|nr:alpha/beta hydrolase [Candidatus Lokiarchaeota archaeon]